MNQIDILAALFGYHDHTFSPHHKRLADLAWNGVPFHGETTDAITATYRAALAVLVALKLGCAIKAVNVGAIGCDGKTYWLVTVVPHLGRCDLLGCMQAVWGCDECDAIEAATPELHGAQDHGAHKIVRGLMLQWTLDHADFVALVAGRLGSPATLSADDVLRDLDSPPPYEFERDFGADTQRIGGAW